MAQVKRFTFAGAYSAGTDVFVAGAGYFRRGVLDIAAGDSAALAAVRAAAPNAVETGPFDDAATPPPPPAGDPYPEYLKYNELVSSIAGETDEIALALRAALKATFATTEDVPPAVQQFVASLVVDNDFTEALAEDTGFVWAQVDAAGRRSMGTRPDGTVDIQKLTTPTFNGLTAPTLDAQLDGMNYAAAWVDQNGRLALWINTDGSVGFPKVDPATLAALAAALGVNTSLAPLSYRTPEGVIRPIVSGPDIVCWGDSLTAGAGSTTAGGSYTGFSGGYPTVLATLTGRTVRNAGVGGENSPTIAARTGATPFLALPAGGSIPASGGVTITFSPINGSTPNPLLQGSGTPGSTFSGTLAGVPGTISQSGGVYTFTRTASGTAVSVTRATPFRTDFSEARRGDIAIFWLGQNGPSDARALTDTKAAIEHLTALNKRYLVIPRPTNTDADDALYHDTFGRRFVAARRYLVDYGLADAGITATTQDNTDIAAGTVPTSLRIDGVHWNAAGYTILANLLNSRLREMGWV